MRSFRYVVAGEVCQINVPEDEHDLEHFLRFLEQPHQFLAFDTETTGLNLFAPGHQLRLVQIGTRSEAWVLRFDRFSEIIKHLFFQRRNFIAHNAPYDSLVLDRHAQIPVETLLPRTWDTKIIAHLADPRGRDEGGIGLGLKELCVAHVDSQATDGAQELTKAFNGFGWTKATGWGRISIDHAGYLLYAGLDVILTSRLFEKLNPIAQQYPDLCKMEHKLQYYLTLLQRKGMLLDTKYVEHLVVNLHNEFVDYCDIAADLGLESVFSTDQVIKCLQDQGIQLTALTPKGKLQVDRAVLEPLADLDRQFNRIGAHEPNLLADAVLRAKRASKWSSSYAEAFQNLRDADDRIHPGINSLQARTARMCLPESERLLTKRGVLHINDVIVGDETIDQHGSWVPVSAIHRYKQQEVVEYRQPHGKYVLRSTPEHRWVQRSDRGKWSLSPITELRRTVVLAPPQQDVFGIEFIADTDGQRIATIVGMLASDGRLWSPPVDAVETGARALLYQTEKRYYHQLRRLIPDEWLSYDKITKVGDHHHELALRMRVMRPILEPLGLMPAPGQILSDHPGLEAWVLQLPIDEVMAFLRAVYMADGSTSSGNKVITIKPAALIRAVRLAGYRLGWLSSVQWAKPSEWSNGPRSFISFRRALWHTRNHTERRYTTDVWCVSTETGTFTADGDLGLYLTGNSIDKPPLQQLPSSDWRIRRAFIPDPGMAMIACDYQAIEMRILAALSDDWTMRNAIAQDLDLHSFTAERVFPDFTLEKLKAKDKKAVQQRKIAKNIGFGKVYGGGAASVARLTGAEEAGVREAMKAYDKTFPGIRRYSQRLIGMAKTGLMEVITPIGRRLPLDPDRLYACTNYMVQSTARDVLAKAVIRAFEAGLGEYLLIPVHDELIGQAPVEDAKDVVAELGKVMATEFKGVTLPTKPEVMGWSWGAPYGAPTILPPMPERRERKLRVGEWAQDTLDLGF